MSPIMRTVGCFKRLCLLLLFKMYSPYLRRYPLYEEPGRRVVTPSRILYRFIPMQSICI